MTKASFAERRKVQHKKTLDTASCRRNRVETSRQIRKVKQQALPKQKRIVPDEENNRTLQAGHVSCKEENFLNCPTADDIPKLVGIFRDASLKECHQSMAAAALRRLVSEDDNALIDKCIEHGVITLFYEMLGCKNPLLVMEAAWAFTNIASSDRTQIVVDTPDVVPLLINLLRHPDPPIRQQVAWCLGNIAGNSVEHRDALLSSDVKIMQNLVLNIEQPDNTSLLARVCWTVANLCRGSPGAKLEYVRSCIRPLSLLLRDDRNSEAHERALWALSYISEGSDARIEAVLKTGIAPFLVKRFLIPNNQDPDCMLAAIRILSNFAAGTDEFTDVVVWSGILDIAASLMQNDNKEIRKEICYLLSNVAGGTMEQMKAFYRNDCCLIDSILERCRNDKHDVKKEAILTICNLARKANAHRIIALVDRGCLGVLSMAMAWFYAEIGVLKAVLCAIEEIALFGKRFGRDYQSILEEFNGMERLLNLLEHPSDTIYEVVARILPNCFDFVECPLQTEQQREAESLENEVVVSPSGTKYSFGVSSDIVSSSRFDFAPSTPTNLGPSSNAVINGDASPSDFNAAVDAETMAMQF